jgi:hypothetical protein
VYSANIARAPAGNSDGSKGPGTHSAYAIASSLSQKKSKGKLHKMGERVSTERELSDDDMPRMGTTASATRMGTTERELSDDDTPIYALKRRSSESAAGFGGQPAPTKETERATLSPAPSDSAGAAPVATTAPGSSGPAVDAGALACSVVPALCARAPRTAPLTCCRAGTGGRRAEPLLGGEPRLIRGNGLAGDVGLADKQTTMTAPSEQREAPAAAPLKTAQGGALPLQPPAPQATPPHAAVAAAAPQARQPAQPATLGLPCAVAPAARPAAPATSGTSGLELALLVAPPATLAAPPAALTGKRKLGQRERGS